MKCFLQLSRHVPHFYKMLLTALQVSWRVVCLHPDAAAFGFCADLIHSSLELLENVFVFKPEDL